ncbi:alpha/beta hydrolase [Streptomyces axinellae]|uniref:Alpha/beta hydrolase n=1 Tax=Streptomyces axinellae TaxID=552788 RepID=A0ABN3Q220_9ACTN
MTVSTVTSPDGTRIAYERHGEGAPVLLVGGAMSTREAGVPLARELARLGMCGIAYDRRGRGDSGDTAPYAPEREAEDLVAVARAVSGGGEVPAFGMSSGGFVLLEAVRAGAPLSRIVLFEPPFTGAAGQPQPPGHLARLAELTARGESGEAIAYFMTEVVGLSPEAAEGARQSPGWEGLKKLAPTLVHDMTLMGDGTLPAADLARVKLPVLVLSSSASTPVLQEGARRTAEALPEGRFRSLPGGFHEVPVGDLAPVVRDFVTG